MEDANKHGPSQTGPLQSMDLCRPRRNIRSRPPHFCLSPLSMRVLRLLSRDSSLMPLLIEILRERYENSEQLVVCRYRLAGVEMNQRMQNRPSNFLKLYSLPNVCPMMHRHTTTLACFRISDPHDALRSHSILVHMYHT
jgi:hypothetical protein